MKPIVTLVKYACVITVLFLIARWVTFTGTDVSNDGLPASGIVSTIQFRQQQLPLFPKLVHQTWKTQDIGALPPNLVRWRKGCQLVNADHELRLHDDASMAKFIETEYPRYYPLFKSLHGVYMADMARVLLVYHFGGVYMDFDFYCTRPLSCLANRIRRYLDREYGDSKVAPQHVLVVSREPLAHALLFHNKSRVVIQDFFMATPKHPFLEWFLNDRAHQFALNISTKGPFSYSIDKDIDAYLSHSSGTSSSREYNNNLDVPNVHVSTSIHFTPAQTTSTASKRRSPSENARNTSLIIELSEDVLHPLLDATNHKLWTVTRESPCNGANILQRRNVYHKQSKTQNITVEYEMLHEQWESACHRLSSLQYFKPTKHTVGVHMWSHVYLFHPEIRSALMKPYYAYVEHMSPSKLTC